MRTTAEDITLCMDLDYVAAQSPESTSTLIDLWSELQLIALESSQAPTPNLFAFAGSCLVFAVIMQNPKPLESARMRGVGEELGNHQEFYPHWQQAGGAHTSQSFESEILPEYQYDNNTVPATVPRPFTAFNSDAYNDDSYTAPWQATPQTSGHLKAIGFVYVISSPQENVPAGEANIGIILAPEAREKGFEMQAGNLVLSYLFDELCFHRVQAGVLDSAGKDWAITLFTQMGFAHEGTRRRSVFCPNEGVRGGWKDVTHLGLLETDWLMRAYLKPAPKNLWDEMFSRHAREREELLRWDERQQRLNRTSSMETLRVLDTLPSEAGSVPSGSVHTGSRAATPSVYGGEDSRASSHPPSDCESEQSNQSWEAEGWESDEAGRRFQRPFSHIPRSRPVVAGTLSPSLSSSNTPSSPPRSISPSSSQWDMLETSSVSSSSFESIEDPGES